MLLSYYVLIVEKVSFSALGFFKMTDFQFRMFYISNHLKFYQKVRSVKKNALTNFGDDIISIDGVGPHKIIRHDVKFWLRHISVINSDIALKLCKLFYFVVAIIWNNNLLEFLWSRLWFTEIPPFTDGIYSWPH